MGAPRILTMRYPGGRYEQASEEGARFLEERGEAVRYPPAGAVETFGPLPDLRWHIENCDCEGTCECEDA